MHAIAHVPEVAAVKSAQELADALAKKVCGDFVDPWHVACCRRAGMVSYNRDWRGSCVRTQVFNTWPSHCMSSMIFGLAAGHHGQETGDAPIHA